MSVLVLVLVCAGVRLNMLVLVCVDAGGYVAILSLKKSGHECVFGLCVCVRSSFLVCYLVITRVGERVA